MFVDARYSDVRAMCSNDGTRGENVGGEWHGEVAVARAWREGDIAIRPSLT